MNSNPTDGSVLLSNSVSSDVKNLNQPEQVLNNDLIITNETINLIKDVEGCRLTAYKDSAGIWTIGYGHTGLDVYEGLRITQHQADILLDFDLNEAAQVVRELVTVPLNNNQFGALVSFVFNLGRQKFHDSTLLEVLNNKQYEKVPSEFSKWIWAGGKTINGLKFRRVREIELWNKKPSQL